MNVHDDLPVLIEAIPCGRLYENARLCQRHNNVVRCFMANHMGGQPDHFTVADEGITWRRKTPQPAVDVQP